MLKIEETILISCGNNAKGHVEIPNGVTKIGDEAFRDCTGLTSIEIPNSITLIGEYAFSGCTGLKEIHFRIEHLSGAQLDDLIFDNIEKSQVSVYVPISAEYEYRNHPLFHDFKEIITCYIVTYYLDCLLNNPVWKSGKYFVGYGNPDSSILIIGKECAIDISGDEGKKQYEEEYVKNFDVWSTKTEIKNWIGNCCLDWTIFHPRAPYKGQKFTIERRRNKEIISGERGTSSTWYNYQKLINNIREQGKMSSSPNTREIDFYNDCFITELNDLPRPNGKNLNKREKQKIKDNIQKRFDLMIATKPFWSHFKTVILACGPYADALRTSKQLSSDIFGDANIISEADGRKIPQLSYAISDHLLKAIADQV